MTFFYDINKKLQQVLDTPKKEHRQLNERAEMADESALQAYLGKKKYGEAGMKALQKAGREHASEKTMDNIRAKHDKMDEGSTGDYSAKKARAGKDIGKPGKAFAQIAKSAGERYGSKERGEKVAGAVLAKLRGKNESVEEGMMDTVKKVTKKVASGVNKLVGHGSDEDMIRDLQRKSGAPVTGKKPTPPQQVKEKMSPAKQKSFAALAPPRDKITFADKIAGAKKEVDEMLGDVAAEAMRNALVGGQKKLDKNHNGKLDAQDFAMLRAGAKKNQSKEMDEERSKGTDFDISQPRARPKVGSIERGHKHDIEHTATGRKVTRRHDEKGMSAGTDDEEQSGEKRGRGRPKGSKHSIGAKGPSGKSKLMTREDGVDIQDQGEYDQEGDMAKDDIKTIVRHAEALSKILGDNDNLPEWVQSKLAKIEGMMVSIDEYMQNQEDDAGEEQEIDERHLTAKEKNKKEQVFKKDMKPKMAQFKKRYGEKEGEGVAHAVATNIAKGVKMGKKKKKEEEVEESSTTSGSVAPSTATTGKASGVFGKGIYDSMNRELEKMIAESMSINMSDSTEGGKSLTVTATDEDAMKLAAMLKMAGVGGGDMPAQGAEEMCPTCGSADCGCGDVHKEVDEAAPDWPTNTETSNDALQYAGGLNKPKTDVAGDGQTTIPNTAVHTQDEDVLRRMMEMAGIKQADLKPWKETMKEDDEDFFHNPNVPKDKQLPAPPKEVNVELDEAKECDSCHKSPCRCDEDLEESIRRMREMAGIREAKKVEEDDVEEGAGVMHFKAQQAKADGKDSFKLGDKEYPVKEAKKKDIDESIFTLTNQWRAYKG